MKDLVLHAITRTQLEDYGRSPSHAVMLVGPTGSGKQTLAVKLAEKVLEIPVDSFKEYPYKLLIYPEAGKSIGIEAVRQLEHFLSLKVPRNAKHNRTVIIQNAELLTVEAQNALLKTLEEPPEGTMIILAVSHDQALLPTIRSRAQSIAVKRPGRTTLESYFKDLGFDNNAVQQTYAISGGLPGLMRALLDQTDHPLLKATAMARQLLGKTAYERLLLVDELSKEKSLAIETTQILQQMAHVSLQSAVGPAAKKWQTVLATAYKAAEDLSLSVQPKLALTELMLGL